MPKDFDLFFTSVSAATVSSMSTVEMEVFTNIQLVFLTILMLFGGEVFTSMLGLHLMRFKLHKNRIKDKKIDFVTKDSEKNSIDHIDQLDMVTHSEDEKPDTNLETDIKSMENEALKFKSITILAQVVSCFLLVVHVAGSSMILMYVSLISNAKQVLKKKQLNLKTFAIFTTVSTFANCGFVPTNENMMIFKKNSGLLLILIPQLLIGNTLYPVCLRLLIWFLEKFTKRAEFRYMLKNSRELGYGHLLPGSHSAFLAFTVFGFIAVQFILFCSLEWNSESTSGVSFYQKIVGSLFQVVNSRHAGEFVFDLLALSPAILVLFVLMMYLPPYTSFLPIHEKISTSENEANSKTKRKNIMENISFSQLSYLVIFIILICITERDKMKRDPLNFSVLNIVLEVTR
ncbi:Sodium transporter HKT1 [Forsythia ovata]|uniref:Sodium transporter HKT1 n=1 Tax=Forsythia ovata TaxID=205694 RepID=A0ABD1SRF4_9LAMI